VVKALRGFLFLGHYATPLEGFRNPDKSTQIKRKNPMDRDKSF